MSELEEVLMSVCREFTETAGEISVTSADVRLAVGFVRKIEPRSGQ